MILVKNLDAQTTEEELRQLFSPHGELGRVLLPPRGVTAIVEFIEPTEAKAAFRKLAYSKFRHMPLYLEWAPVNVFRTAPNAKPCMSSSSNNVFLYGYIITFYFTLQLQRKNYPLQIVKQRKLISQLITKLTKSLNQIQLFLLRTSILILPTNLCASISNIVDQFSLLLLLERKIQRIRVSIYRWDLGLSSFGQRKLLLLL